MSRNNDDIFNLRNLAMERRQAREKLKGNATETKERFRPSNLVEEAKDKALDQVLKTSKTAVDGVKAHPGITATVAATATLIALRKPLAKLITDHRATNDNPTEE